MFSANLFCSHETDCSREKVEDRALKRTEGVYYCSLIWLRSMQCNVSSQARKTTFSFFCHVLTLPSTEYGHQMKTWIKEIWKFGLMWQTIAALVVPKNWELNFSRAAKTISSQGVRSPCSPPCLKHNECIPFATMYNVHSITIVHDISYFGRRRSIWKRVYFLIGK